MNSDVNLSKKMRGRMTTTRFDPAINMFLFEDVIFNSNSSDDDNNIMNHRFTVSEANKLHGNQQYNYRIQRELNMWNNS